MNSQFKLTLLSSAVLALTACGGSSDSEPEQPVIDPPAQNQAPTIELATAMDALERDKVEITPTITDDGSISTYLWEQTSGDSVELDATDGATLSFTAPDLAQATTLTFSVTATDNEGASTTSSVDVQIAAYPEVDLSLVSDAGLKSCLQEHDDMDAGATELMCQFHAVSSIDGLQQFSKLSSLHLDNAQFVSIPDLSQFEHLSELSINASTMESFNNLDSASSLSSLRLADFNCENILRLDDLTNLNSLSITCASNDYSVIDLRNVNNENLTELMLVHKANSNIEGLTSMHSLESLSLYRIEDFYYSDDSLTSLSFLQQMPELTSLVVYGHPELTDLSALSFTPKLTSLYFEGTLIEDLSILEKVPALESLYLISQVRPAELSEDSVNTIAGLENLKELELTGYSPLNTRPFSALKNLQSASFRSSSIASLAFIESLPELKSLTVEDNDRLADITPIEAIQLESLELGRLSNVAYIDSIATQTSLKSLRLGSLDNDSKLELSFLKNLDQLTSLTLDQVDLYNPEEVSDLTSLEYLAFTSAYFEQLPDLSRLTNLEELRIDYSYPLKSLEGLSAASNLTKLSLSNLESVDDYSEIGELSNLEQLSLTQPHQLANSAFLSKLEQLQILEIVGAPQLTYVANSLEGLESLMYVSLRSSTSIACSDIKQLETQFTNINFIHSNDCLNNPIDLSLFKDAMLKRCVADSWSLDVSELTNLYCYDYNAEGVADLSGLEQLTELQYLDLRGGLTADVQALSNLTSLTKLESLQLESSSAGFPLQRVVEVLPPNLTSLNFSSSDFTDLSPLAYVPSGLTSLYLRYMDFKDISPLLGLVQLDLLNLYGNDSLDCEDIKLLEQNLVSTSISHSAYCY